MIEKLFLMRSFHAVLFLLVILATFCIVPASAHVIAEPIVDIEILEPGDISGVTRALPIEGSVT
ncbi:hypothetical protein McpCs1_18350 [Methanocorpusculaceae archaeon Cs1]|uniref:Uncharacterized protein n=2 Tax=Methanorbis rubei TaxID=3028300 RepID=A0AAE4SCV6_9EURY|nr:hypothetical protein [Methanocorpusculaceae archaeon Cs1]